MFHFNCKISGESLAACSNLLGYVLERRFLEKLMFIDFSTALLWKSCGILLAYVLERRLLPCSEIEAGPCFWKWAPHQDLPSKQAGAWSGWLLAYIALTTPKPKRVQTCVNKASSDWRRWVAITAAVSQIAFWSGGRSGARCWGPVPTKIWSSRLRSGSDYGDLELTVRSWRTRRRRRRRRKRRRMRRMGCTSDKI